MATAGKATKRNAASMEEASLSDSGCTREDEKTIPFLRRLTDMLRENDDVISFFPGYRSGEQVVLGKIIVHDRRKVESDVLPRYFNHASFASLRRQLNYFSFTRVGKGRQRGATYCNEGVVELEDILHLKRRAVGTSTNSRENGAPARSDPSSLHDATKAEVQAINSHQSEFCSPKQTKRCRSGKSNGQSLLPPRLSSVNVTVIGEEVSAENKHSARLAAKSQDLPSSCELRQFAGFVPQRMHQDSVYRSLTANYRYLTEIPLGDADILAGCNALLSFSKSHHNDGIKYTA